MATLSMADNADGTGAVGTVAGGGATDSNTLYYSTWAGTSGTLSFTSAGSRIGNGTIAASVAVGYYVWLLESVVVATNVKTNTIVYQNTTTTAAAGDPVLYRIMSAVKTQIVALSLSGITSTSVLLKWLPRQLDTTTDPVPCVIVSPAPMAEQDVSYLTATDHQKYPILISLIDKQNQDYTANLSRNLLWREKIFREFRFQPIDGVAEAVSCVIEPKSIVDPVAFNKQLFASSLVLRVICRETRGN